MYNTAGEYNMPRLVPDATDQQISRYTAKIGANGGKNRWEGFSAEQRKELMRQVRASKAARPKASERFHIANSVFKTQNALSKRERKT